MSTGLPELLVYRAEQWPSNYFNLQVLQSPLRRGAYKNPGIFAPDLPPGARRTQQIRLTFSTCSPSSEYRRPEGKTDEDSVVTL